MRIGVIADDFTGASDIANTLARGAGPEGGLRTAQFSGVPEGPACETVEAGVISLKSRTAPVQQAVEESLAALRWLQAQGCSQIVFKYCSTFDSTPKGNIGPVSEALAKALCAEQVIFCPAFPGAGRRVFQGHLFVNDRLLNECGMQSHPLTPMTDPDIRRWLARQTAQAVGLLPAQVVAGGATAISAQLAAVTEPFLIADATSDADLLALGEALAAAPLVTGGSGIALGLARNHVRQRMGPAPAMGQFGVSGPAAILAGSCSGATRGQVAHHARSHPVLAIDVAGVMAGAVTAQDLVAFCLAHEGKAPLAYSSGTPEEVAALQARFGRAAVAARLDALFAETARALLGAGLRRLVIAGGETSGAVAQAVTEALRVPAMEIGPEIDPGVPVLGLQGGPGNRVALALKSGNFGAPDFFAKALRVMEQGA
ncbi:3-oxo-tetronate kinase [Pseudoruegeria sp. SHC-113]|uniref:3-oxo-tetronate kinase n=1 Tax=Pseudoruegeria sp. SHC-113 TaxID=2855439 RepID=UPI0021BB29FB|nr:3-oxo-tetronate kinase [Pseudoruegeria sp. SHC-113]MCT8161617.1 four-carbon acid sugar kinase family protein [Pseudoruegeria sp. SHC-113]